MIGTDGDGTEQQSASPSATKQKKKNCHGSVWGDWSAKSGSRSSPISDSKKKMLTMHTHTQSTKLQGTSQRAAQLTVTTCPR